MVVFLCVFQILQPLYMADRHTFVRFGGSDPPLGALDQRVRACVTASASPTAACDDVMAEFCSQPANAQTSYCACINSAVPAAGCYFAPCTNSAYAYQLSTRAPHGGRTCPPVETVCVQAMDVNASDSVVRYLSQTCGGAGSTPARPNRLLVVWTFLLLFALVFLLGVRPHAPTPPSGLLAPLLAHGNAAS